MTKTSIILIYTNLYINNLYTNAEKSYIFNRMRIYSTVQLCSITSLWHSGQHLCRAIGRLQVRISLGFWLLSKRRSLRSWLLWKKTFLAGLQCTLTSSCAKTSRERPKSAPYLRLNKLCILLKSEKKFWGKMKTYPNFENGISEPKYLD